MKKAAKANRAARIWAPALGGVGVSVTDDQMWRGAITAASIPVYQWLISKAKAYLSRRRSESGRGLAERVGYGVGSLWPLCKKGCNRVLHGRGV